MNVRDSWIAADWQAPPNIVAGCTLRHGGVSRGPYASLNLGIHVGDDAAAVAENRSRFAARCELPAEPRWLTQVHGSRVVRDAEAGSEADAAITANSGQVCVVMVADCLPVLLTDAAGTEVAAAHAGWRGLADGVLENTVDAFTAAPSRLQAWLGPAISAPSFEVGSEVRERFVDQDPAAAASFRRNDRGRWQADLPGLARQRLSAMGVTSIHGGQYCTYLEPDRFFSYRRDGQCGRMAAYIFRRG